MKAIRIAASATLVLFLGAAGSGDAQSDRKVVDVMKSGFKARGQAQLDRLDQDEMQAACSRLPSDGALPGIVAERIQKANLDAVKYPADGKFMGDWRKGEAIAQSGRGMQFNDDPKKSSGGNCYACHQLSGAELSYGTIGPSLRHYGKVRGAALEVQRFTYTKIYNSHAYQACSNMPRFGHKGILTEEQLKHLVALLLDPDSPVNK